MGENLMCGHLTSLSLPRLKHFWEMSRSEIFGAVRLEYKTPQILTDIRSNKKVFRTSTFPNLLFTYLHPSVDLCLTCVYKYCN